MNTLWFLLPGITYLGIITSYTDIKYGKIMNRDVLIGICYALAVYFILTAYLFFQGTLNLMYLFELGTNAVFALAVAFGLWYYKIWSAGDGKLFFAFVLLLPLEVYGYGKYNWIPSLSFLINIFIAGLLVMVILIVKDARLKHYKKAFSSFFKDLFSLKFLLSAIASLFAILWAVQIVLSLVGVGRNPFLIYFLAILIFSKLPSLRLFAPKKGVLHLAFLKSSIICIILLLRLVFDKSVYSLQFLRDFALLVFIGIFIRKVLADGLNSLGTDLFSKNVSIKKISEGTLLGNNLVRVKKLSREEEKELLTKRTPFVTKGNFSYVLGGAGGKTVFKVSPTGLTRRQIKKLRKFGFKKIGIGTTIPFAPIIFLGVISLLI